MNRGIGGVLVAAVLVVGLAGTCLAGAMYRNDSGAVARAVRIEFSEPAEITSMWPSFPQRDPQGPATVIVLSGGEVRAGGWFSFTWRPDTARVLALEWISLTPASASPARATAALDVRSFSTSFLGSAIDYCLWEEWSWGGGRATQDGRLALTTDAASEYSMARLITQYWLDGDFQIEVKLSLLDGWRDTIAGTGQYPRLSAGVGVYVDDSVFVDFARVRSGTQDTFNAYSTLGGGVLVASRPTFGDQIVLRVVRRNAEIILDLNEGSGWREVARVEFVTTPVRIYLSSATLGTAKASSTAFDSFELLEGKVMRDRLAWTDEYRHNPEFIVGGWVCDYLAHREWNRYWHGSSPLQIMKDNGFEWVRVWVTMTSSSYLRETPRDRWRYLPWRDEYWSSIEYATAIMKEASALGMRLNAVLTLSSTAAHAGQQIPPPGWEHLSVAETCERLEQYGFDTAIYFKQAGLDVEIYDIGNEIDWGILGFRPGERLPRIPGVDQTRNMTYLRESVWPVTAELVQAVIRGIRRADPKARIALHVAGLLDQNTDFAASFFEFMASQGVDFDIAGFSLPYPESGWTLHHYTRRCWYQRVQDLAARIARTGKQVFISEGSYPSSNRGIAGQPMPDYPFTPEGQAAWVRDLLRFASADPNIQGFFYFYPDWFPGMSQDTSTWHVQSYGLFSADGLPHPAICEFQVNLPPQR